MVYTFVFILISFYTYSYYIIKVNLLTLHKYFCYFCSFILLFTGPDYTFIPSRRGHELLMLNGYTYAKTRHYYYCSKIKSGCKARVKFDRHGKLVLIHTEHGHKPPEYLVTSNGDYIKVWWFNEVFSGLALISDLRMFDDN